MWQILAIAFMIAFVVCLVKAAAYKVGTMALLKYMADKHYTLPSDEEIAACSKWVGTMIARDLKVKGRSNRY